MESAQPWRGFRLEQQKRQRQREAALDGLITHRRSIRSALAKLWLKQTCPLVCVQRQTSVLPYIRHLSQPIYFEEKAISLWFKVRRGLCMSACCRKVLEEEKWVNKCVYVAGCYVVNRSARYSNPLDVCVCLPITKQEELTDLRKEGNCSYTATIWQTSNRTGQGVYSWKLINCWWSAVFMSCPVGAYNCKHTFLTTNAHNVGL